MDSPNFNWPKRYTLFTFHLSQHFWFTHFSPDYTQSGIEIQCWVLRVYIMSFWVMANHGRTNTTCILHTHTILAFHFVVGKLCGKWYKLLIDMPNTIVIVSFFCLETHSTTKSRILSSYGFRYLYLIIIIALNAFT